MSDGQPKSSRYVTCRCQHCDKGIEFDASEFNKGENRNVECPHCHLETIIFVPPSPVTSSLKPERQSKFAVLLMAIGGCILVVAGLIWLVAVSYEKNKAVTNSDVTTNIFPTSQPTVAAASTPQPSPPPVPKTEEEQIDQLKAKPLLMSSEEKAARDDILKALLDVSSATAVGVNRNSYSDLLTKALSTLTFEKTKLSAERHEKFLECAEKAIRYYTKANDEWSDYFKYDWMRDRNETFMYQYDFDDLRQNGVTVDTTQYSHDANINEAFVVPFDDCLSLYWKAADVYIEKMKDDVQQ
jgi:hypothetical protein